MAILSAMETVNPDVPSTIEAAALCKMADRGQITGGILDGPLALDNAINLEAAGIKKIKSPVAGRANVLIVPDLEAGNMLAKSLLPREGRLGGIVLGAKVPIMLTSRADSAWRVSRRARWRRSWRSSGATPPPRRSPHERRDPGPQRRLVEHQVLAFSESARSRLSPAGRWRQSTPSRSSLRADAAGKQLAEKRWPAQARSSGTKARSRTSSSG